MANKVAKLVKLKAKEFNKKRKILRTPGITLTLQIKDGEEDTFIDLMPVVTEDWLHEHDSYREKMRVMVAKVDEIFKVNLLKATDVLIGSDRYEIDKRDILQPEGDRPYWRIYGIMNPETY